MEIALDHVAIAVPSIAAAQPLFETLVGGLGSGRESVPSQGVEVVFIGAAPGRLELLQPTSPDSPLARFLEKRGPGLHHIAYRVADIAAELDRLDRAGVELIDRTARPGALGHLVAFLHPRSCGGVLVELVQHRP